MPEAYVAGLDDQVRHKMIDLLNARLSDAIALTLAVKQAHWNLRGRGFIGVHELLDEVADRLREGSDMMAERAALLGGYAKGTVEVVAQSSSMKAYPVEMTDLEDHVAALTERFTKVGEAVREAIDAAEEAGDADTADLFTEVSRALDKDAWFIGANAPRAS